MCCCSVSSLFLSCVLCACDLLIVKIWHLRAGYPASNLKRFLKRGATRIVCVCHIPHTLALVSVYSYSILVLLHVYTVIILAFTRYCFTSRLYCTIIFFANTPFIVQCIAQYYQLLHPPAKI